MKKYYVVFFLFFLISTSCQKKKETELIVYPIHAEINPLRIDPTVSRIDSQFADVDITTIARLTKADYDALQLSKVKALEGYDYNDLSSGRTILSDENGKLLIVQVITDGEVAEFLLSYDKDGKLVDNLMVAYEDMVEYYREVSSKIDTNKITVQTVDFTYEDENGNPVELSDTSILKYQITPEFQFLEN